MLVPTVWYCGVVQLKTSERADKIVTARVLAQ